MKLINNIITASILSLTLSGNTFAAKIPTIEHINTIKTGDKKGTEIISIQASQQRAAISNSKKGIIDIYSLSSPEAPSRTQRIHLDLSKGEHVTSVAFHPSSNYVIAAIQASIPTMQGHAEIRNATTGAILKSVSTGIGPDAVIIDPTGHFALIPNEAEEFTLNRENTSYSSAQGSITLIKLSDDPDNITASLIDLPDLTGSEGFVAAKYKRFLERGIDWNNDGDITEDPLDLNGNGKIDKDKVAVGTFRGITIMAEEKNGEMFMFPLVDNKPDVLEPEYAVFSKDGKTVWVVLQENNGIVVIDTETAKITGKFGLGMTSHLADIHDDGVINFDTQFTALREPDGITLSADDKYIITADEGDTDPKAAKTKNGSAGGGGRTISVFDAATGNFLGDTGNQIDSAVNSAGFYPESRSDNKGSEPEMVTSFKINDINYAVAGLERANGAALISLANPKQPKVISVAAIDKTAKAGKIAPEGIAHLHDIKTDTHYLYTANEKNGSISTFKININ